MNLILFDDPEVRDNLLPFTFTRPVCDIRIGILTIREKWEKRLKVKSSSLTEEYLAEKFPLHTDSRTDNLWVNGSVCPNAALIKELKALKPGCALFSGKTMVAIHSGKEHKPVNKALSGWGSAFRKVESKASFLRISKRWEIFKLNGEALAEDFSFLTKGRKSQSLSKTNKVLGKSVFVEKGAKVECSVLNCLTGPIYIGKNAEIMEGSLVRGPFALCEEGVLKLGTKVYGPSTVGPFSKVGGEFSNSVIFGYSNKAHDGFLGNSVLGEWCNLGADTNNSNLKNNYGEVKLYNYNQGAMEGTGLQFCGLMMGDHSKAGINTMFNTGTVVGICANVFGGGFPDTFIPDFSWGGAAKMETFRPEKAIELAARVYERRHLVLEEEDKRLLLKVFELTAKLRKG